MQPPCSRSSEKQWREDRLSPPIKASHQDDKRESIVPSAPKTLDALPIAEEPGTESNTASVDYTAQDNGSNIISVEQRQDHLSVTPASPARPQQPIEISRRSALLLATLLIALIINASRAGATRFISPQGWSSILGGSNNKNDTNLLRDVRQQLHSPSTAGTTAQTRSKITLQQYIDTIIHDMTLDMKLGQMMMIQFVGPDYSLDLNQMISQYHVGGVLIFDANQNIVNKMQVKNLIKQMQKNSSLPLIVAIDQEGGYVNRLLKLNGARPAAATIGATNDPAKAKAAGIQDAKDLSFYGINLNLAPVVDVDNNNYSALHTDQRTYGNNAALVTKMARAYLQGLQQHSKVLGTLKHFPGLGAVATDPHVGVPRLTRSKADLERIDWVPYRTLIHERHAHAIMVTHEILTAFDSTLPATLSPKIVTGILRDKLAFQGVIMTDSLTMKGVTNYVSEEQATVLAIAAGSDLLMGASTPSAVASMIESIKKALQSGKLHQQCIDDSVRRILTMKYKMGLLSLPTN